MVPQFLNPYTPPESAVAKADRKIWSAVQKEFQSEQITQKFAKKGKMAKTKESREMKKAAREKYGFHQDLLFANSFHMLFLKQQKKLHPNKTLKVRFVRSIS